MRAGSRGVVGTRKLHQVVDASILTHAGTVATDPPGGRGSHLKGEICAMVTITLIGSWTRYNNPQKTQKRKNSQAAHGTRIQ